LGFFNRNPPDEKQMQRAAVKFVTGAIETAFKNSGYSHSGASYQKKSVKGWHSDSRSPQEDIDMNLWTLRQRSRDLFMSAPLARGAINTHAVNIVGAGLVCKPKIDFDFLGMTRDEAKVWELNTLREFNLWADDRHCDATKVNNFYEMQMLELTSWLLNGDGIALITSEPVTPFMPYSLRIHLIESDRVCNPNTTTLSGLTGQVWVNADTGNRVYNGVEIDDNGAIVAYWVCNTYPNSYIPTTVERKWTRITAFGDQTGMQNILHVMHAERPEQYRGVPLLAPVIESMKQLLRYIDAELLSSVIQSFFTAFITSTAPTGGIPIDGNSDDFFNTPTSGDIPAVPDNPMGDYKLAPGAINHLMPGESVTMADPKHPGGNFDSFVTAMARYVGTALDLPYELMLKSFTSSYSASRGALLEAWKGFRMRRTWFARDFCQPIYETWLAEAVARGRIKAPGFFTDPIIRKAWSKAEWNGPSPGQLDPVKEVQAASMRIALGVSTHEREATELTGTDFDSNIETDIRENAKIKEANDILTPAPVPAAFTSSDMPTGEKDTDNDTEKGEDDSDDETKSK
jgi:lambda family phage portal protein